MKKLIISIPFLFILGCAAPQVIMVHPETGDLQKCSQSGMGLTAAIAAKLSVSNCVGQLEDLGYKKAADLTPEERARVRPTGQKDLGVQGEIKSK